MYNFGIFLANETAQEYQRKKHKEDNKLRYAVDFSSAIRVARKYLLRPPDAKPIDICKLLSRYVHAIKEEFRQFDRPLREIDAVHFAYR